LLIILGLTIGRNATALAANFGRGAFVGSGQVTAAFVVAFGAALVGSLFSSDAWNNVTFAAPEVQNPKRNLPLALVLGTGLVTTVGLFFLRMKRPDVERPYRAFGYPLLPGLYLALTVAVMLLIILSPATRQDAFLGLALVLVGIPVYFLWRRAEAS